jgi:hypothetical protein
VLTFAAGKTVKREVKVLKAKCNDESLVVSFDAQNAEWQGEGYISDFQMYILLVLLKYCMFLPFGNLFFYSHCYLNC